MPLYGVHDLAARPGVAVVLVEGEKARDALAAPDFVVLGTVTGAGGTPSDAVLRALAGRDVVLWPDADGPGREHMRRMGERLTALGITYRTIDPWPDATDGRDPADCAGTEEELRALLGQAAPASVTTAPRLSRPLSVILADPAALEPPAPVVPRLAWRGRTTLLAAREKAGKSTPATAAAAAVSRGASWLTDPTTPGVVLWLTLEEHVSDLAARMAEWAADTERVHVIDTMIGLDDPIARLHVETRAVAPALVVIDTLSALVDASGARPDPGSSAAWTPIMAALNRIARETDAAVLILHHARKSDGAYRDSSAIGAGVDVIVEMADGGDAEVRALRVRGRWRVGDYSVRLVGDRYELTSGEPSLDARVLLYVKGTPDARFGESARPSPAAQRTSARRSSVSSPRARSSTTAMAPRSAYTRKGRHPTLIPSARGEPLREPPRFRRFRCREPRRNHPREPLRFSIPNL